VWTWRRVAESIRAPYGRMAGVDVALGSVISIPIFIRRFRIASSTAPRRPVSQRQRVRARSTSGCSVSAPFCCVVQGPDGGGRG
jgi:hypothetical protein